MKDVADERLWQWMRGGYLDKRREGYVCAAQENVLKTRYYCATVMKQGGEGKCRKCGGYVETVGHLISGCKMLAQREYRRRHDRMGLRVYWELCGKYGLKRSEKVPDPVRTSADGKVEIRWDQKIVIPKAIEHSRPDVVVIDRASRRWTLIDFAVPFDANVATKEREKVKRYEELAALVSREHRVVVEIVPVVVGALGVVSKKLDGWLKRLGIGDVIRGLQTATLIGTVAILQKVLSTDA